MLRARELAIPIQTIPNASILSAIGSTGLQLYNFGQTVSMVFFTETWKPSSFYDRVQENVQIGLHTLVLLDIKVKEQSLENMARGRKIYEPPRYMTVSQCAQQMLETEAERKEGVYGKGSLAKWDRRYTAWCCLGAGDMSSREILSDHLLSIPGLLMQAGRLDRSEKMPMNA